MIILISSAFALIPTIFIFKLINDKLTEERRTALIISAAYGAVCIISVILTSMLLNIILSSENDIINTVIKSFIYNGAIPEIMKALLFLIIINKYEYEDKEKIMIFIIMGLSFACFENIFYSTSKTFIMRSLFSVAGNIMWTVIPGYYFLAGSKNNNKPEIAAGIIIGAFYHGVYNFILFSSNLLNLNYLIFAPVIIIGLIFLHFKYIEKKLRLIVKK